MNKNFSLFLAVPLVVPMVLALSAGGCINMGQAKFQRTVTASATMATPKPVKISTENGSVTVTRSSTGQIEITADSALQTAERRDAFSIRAEADGDAFVIEPVWPDGKRSSGERCAFVIALPESAGLTIETSNGAIEISAFSGDTHLHTSNGRITVNGHEGPLDLHTSNGAINATKLNGTLKARTSNGRITVAFAQGATGPIDAKTSNGAIDLDVPDSFAGVLSLSTSNGNVKVEAANGAKADIKKRSGTITFVTAGSPSTIETSNGSITVKHAPAGSQ